MACSPARTACTAWPPVSAPSAGTYSSVASRRQSRWAPRRATVCSGTTDPRSRTTSTASYARRIPRQRDCSTHCCASSTASARIRASLIAVVPFAELGARALGQLGRALDIDVAAVDERNAGVLRRDQAALARSAELLHCRSPSFACVSTVSACAAHVVRARDARSVTLVTQEL